MVQRRSSIVDNSEHELKRVEGWVVVQVGDNRGSGRGRISGLCRALGRGDRVSLAVRYHWTPYVGQSPTAKRLNLLGLVYCECYKFRTMRVSHGYQSRSCVSPVAPFLAQLEIGPTESIGFGPGGRAA